MISGLRGRLTGPDIRELPFFVPVDDPGGSAVDAFDAVDTLRLVTLDRLDGRVVELVAPAGARAFAGERSAIAEFGRDGSLPAALAFLCSAITSLNVLRLAVPGREVADVVVTD